MAFSFVQSKKDTSGTVTFDNAVTAGNLVVVGITTFAADNVEGDITDNKGNTYHKVVSSGPGFGSTDFQQIFYSIVGTGGSSFIVDSANDGTIMVAEYSGVGHLNVVDQSNGNTGNSTSPNSGNITTTRDGDLFVGVAWSLHTNDTWTANNSFTIREQEVDNDTFERGVFADKIGNIQTTSADFTVDTSGQWGCVVAAFKAAERILVTSRTASGLRNAAGSRTATGSRNLV